ncbi:unnamed protein product, partial [Oncorhynchus mykiss]
VLHEVEECGPPSMSFGKSVRTSTFNFSNNCLQIISIIIHCITIPVCQKFTYTKLTVPLNSLENVRKLCNGFRSVPVDVFQGLPINSVLLCLTSWENQKKSAKTSEKNCRPPQVWFILGSNFQTPEGTTFICTNNSTKVSISTVKRVLYRRNLKGRSARKKPLLQNLHKKARLRFATAHGDKDRTFWRNVLWSDETEIELFGHNDHRYEWAKIHPTYCGKLVEGYPKRLTQVKQFKDNATKY